MSNLVRYTNNDDEIRRLIQTVRRIEDTFVDMVADHKPFVTAAEDHGLNYDRLRNFVRKLQNMPIEHDAGSTEKNPLMLPKAMPFSPYERAYCEIMGIDYAGLGRIQMPERFGEALEKAVELVLSREEAEAFCRYVSGDPVCEIAAGLYLDTKETKKLYSRAKLKLREFAESDILLTQGMSAWEQRQEKIERQRYALLAAAKEKQEEDTQQILPGNTAMQEISCLTISARCYNALMRAKCTTIGQLWEAINNNSIYGINGIGPKSREEIIHAYTAYVGNAKEDTTPAKQEETAPEEEDAMDVDISVLGLSPRAHTALLRAGCRTMGQLWERIKKDNLTTIRNLGVKTRDEIVEKYNNFLAQSTPGQEEIQGCAGEEAIEEEKPQEAA